MPSVISKLLTAITLTFISLTKSSGQLVKLLIIFFQTIFKFSFRLVSTILSYIYDVGFTKTLSGEVYKKWADSQPTNFDGINRILDIGIGTGTPLKNIMNQIPSNVISKI